MNFLALRELAREIKMCNIPWEAGRQRLQR